jgi:HlyD family secretion protein
MIASTEEAILIKKKRGIRLAAGLFIGSLLVLTFFSNTYRQLTLPKVSVAKAEFGQLAHNIEGSGALEPERTASLYDRSGWKVLEVLVKEGDTVTEGQKLITFDSSQAERTIADEQDRYKQQQLRMEKLQNDLKATGIGGDEDKVESIKRDIASLRLDMDIQSRKLANLREELREKSALVAPFSGIVTELRAEEGLTVSQGQAAAEIADPSQGLNLTVNVKTELADRLVPGESVQVRIKGTTPRLITGKVHSVEKTAAANQQGGSGSSGGSGKEVTVRVNDKALTGGELAEFELTKRTGSPRPLIPNEAIHQDGGGEYVFVVEEKKRPLGNEFRVGKKYINTDDSDETSTALMGGMDPQAKIVTESAEPLSDGDRVRLE